MRLEQEKDQFLTRIKESVVTDARPNIDQISTFDYEEKLLWARFEELVVVNGLLCLAEKSGMTSSLRIIPPRQLRQEILIKYHEGIGGGHLGFEKTFIKLKERFYWPCMKEEAKLACANCVRCGSRKNNYSCAKTNVDLHGRRISL